MKINAKGISPEIVAVISAAVNMMMGPKVAAVKIKRSDIWAMAGRHRLMN